MKATQYRTLLFDFGNVLIDIDSQRAFSRLKEMLIKENAQAVLDEVLPKYETGLISTDIFINTLLSQCHHTTQALDIIEAWNSMLIGIPAYRLEMLTMLKPKYGVYMVSNTNEMHIEWIHRHLQKHHGIHDFEKRFFDGVYYSHLVKDRKPNASIYKHIMADSFITPANTLFMDDVPEYLEAAEKLGFGTYLVKEKEEIAEFLKVEGFY